MPKLTNWHPTSHSWFLGIGIDKYQDFNPLHNAVKGISEIKSILLDQYDVDEECVMTLFDKKATKENIVDTLDDLGQKIKPGDKLVIYYSGHGHLNDTLGLGYWIPVDAKKGKASSYLANSTIRDYVKGIKAKHILLVSDSCFSGSLFMQGAFRTSRAVKELDGLASRWAICSGRHDEEVYDGTPGENSPFTQSFVDYLNANDKESVNVARVADHVIEQTAANYEQLPDGRPMFGVGHQGGQYIFWKKDSVGPPSASTNKKTSSRQTLSASIVPPPFSKLNKGFLYKIVGGVALLAIGLFFGAKMWDNNEQVNELDSSELLTLVENFSEVGDKQAPSELNKTEMNQNRGKNGASNNNSTRQSQQKASIIANPEQVMISNVNDAVIELYELTEFKGRMFPLYGANSSTIDNFGKIEVAGLEFNDVISSLTLAIPSDYEFVLYENKKQKGEMISLSGNGKLQNFPNIGSLLGKVSSCELRKKK